LGGVRGGGGLGRVCFGTPGVGGWTCTINREERKKVRTFTRNLKWKGRKEVISKAFMRRGRGGKGGKNPCGFWGCVLLGEKWNPAK